MKRKLIASLVALGAVWWVMDTIEAAGGAGEGGASHSLDPLVLWGVAVILIVAKISGELFERIGQPAVLGELIGGILVGNLTLVGINFIEPLKSDLVLASLADIGVIILLFEVGLESNLKEMLEVGWSSLLVATVGVVAPFLLGWGVSAYFIPNEARLGHIFIGATLAATSVGITARVLKDMNKLATREARIILGAAVIDDILGLLILAVVVGAINSVSTGAELALLDIVWVAGKAVLFLLSAIIIGQFVVPKVLWGLDRFEGRGILLPLALAFCFLLAWAAKKVGLAEIVGAFAAGLVLDEVHFKKASKHDKSDLLHLLIPVSSILVPIFFVMMGLRVDLSVFARPDLLGFALILTLVAIVGKQVCSLAVVESGVNRVAIGLGMIPRGEVGLIFAGIGATLFLPDAQGVPQRVIDAGVFGVIIVMVIVTTLITPPALKWSLARKKS